MNGAPLRLDLLAALLVGLAGVGLELYQRRATRFVELLPEAFAAYVAYLLLFYVVLALVADVVARLGARLIPSRDRPRLAARAVFLAQASILFGIPMVPVLLKHIGLRYLLRPDPYNFVVVSGIGLVAFGLVWVARAAGRHFAGRRPRRPGLQAVAFGLVFAVYAGWYLGSNDRKLILLDNTTFSGQITGAILRTLDLDRDGFSGRWLSGSDPDDLDPTANLFDDRSLLDPGAGKGTRLGALPPAADSASAISGPRRPNIILVIPDAIRYERTGRGGNPRPTTPNLDALAARGAWFENCFVAVSQSVPSFTTIFTGTYPHTHGLGAGSWRQAPKAPYIWSALSPHYETLSFTYSRHSSFGPTGKARLSHETGEALSGEDYDPAPRELFDWLRRPRERPFFAWVYFKNLHGPYYLPPEWDVFRSPPRPDPIPRFESPRIFQRDVGGSEKSRIIDSYDGALRFIDTALGRLWQLLEEEGLAESTILVFASDHGESFYEHDRYGHAFEAYDEQIRVPLLVVGPGVKPAAYDLLVPIIDLAPTLLDLAGLEPMSTFEGRSIVPLLRGGSVEPYPFVPAVAGYSLGNRAYYDKVAIRTREWKLIYTPRFDVAELYDLRADPGELRNLADTLPDRREELMKVMRSWPGFYPNGTARAAVPRTSP